MKQIILTPVQSNVVHISQIAKEPIVGVLWHTNNNKGLLYRARDGYQCIQSQSDLCYECKTTTETLEEYMKIYPSDKFYEFEKVSDLLKWLVE